MASGKNVVSQVSQGPQVNLELRGLQEILEVLVDLGALVQLEPQVSQEKKVQMPFQILHMVYTVYG